MLEIEYVQCFDMILKPLCRLRLVHALLGCDWSYAEAAAAST